MDNNVELIIASQELHIKILELFETLTSKIESNHDEASIVITALASTLTSIIKAYGVEDVDEFLSKFLSFVKNSKNFHDSILDTMLQ